MSKCAIDETCGFDDAEKARACVSDWQADLGESVERAEGACPVCASPRVISLLRSFSSGARMSGCFDCRALWETIPSGEQYMRDGELMPWMEPCDNCAFRAGSPESKDREKWRELLAKLKAGGQFYCHKGVPIKQDEIDDGFVRFAYPETAEGQPDKDRLRTCRGYLNAWVRWMGFPRDPIPQGEIVNPHVFEHVPEPQPTFALPSRREER